MVSDTYEYDRQDERPGVSPVGVFVPPFSVKEQETEGEDAKKSVESRCGDPEVIEREVKAVTRTQKNPDEKEDELKDKNSGEDAPQFGIRLKRPVRDPKSKEREDEVESELEDTHDRGALGD